MVSHDVVAKHILPFLIWQNILHRHRSNIIVQCTSNGQRHSFD